MEETSVVIVGGGPVGTLLAVLLSRNFNIPTILLEKETSIPPDPRAFSLTQQGVRCLQAVGLYDDVYTKMGQYPLNAHFVTGKHFDVNKAPMLAINLGLSGFTGHPGNVLFDQPIMEQLLRDRLPPGVLRTGAEVIDIKEDNHVSVKYRQAGVEQVVSARFLVGCDGRRGFVRKKYLEPRGVILERTNPAKQEFVGMNWDILQPTPKTHPGFPLWAKGYTPDEVLDAFAPRTFKFMCNPNRNVVFSRAGVWTSKQRLWRSEVEVLAGENPETLSAPEAVAGFVKPYMTHSGKKYGLTDNVTFPVDCMQPRRSWHYTFESRMCDRWYDGSVLLAGDAAHIFPPYGGQGVTQGFLDVFGLSWRLAQGIRSTGVSSTLFDSWQEERKLNVKESLDYTYAMRDIFEERNPIKLVIREVLLWFLQLIPFIRKTIQKPPPNPSELRTKYADGMAFLPKLDGGKTLYQCYCRGLKSGDPVVFSDDVLFSRNEEPFALLVLSVSVDKAVAAQEELNSLDPYLPTTYIVTDVSVKEAPADSSKIVRVASGREFAESPLCNGRPPPTDYDEHVLQKQYRGKRFIVVRADRIVFAACRDVGELKLALGAVKRVCAGGRA